MKHSILLLLFVAACGDNALQIPCQPLAMPSEIATRAGAWQLDDYGTSAHCEGDHANGPPISTRRFRANEPITIDLAPGLHTVVLWALASYDDDVVLASGCAEKSLPAGGQICLDLTLAAQPDGATLPDFSAPTCDVTCGNVCCHNANGTCSDTCVLTCNAGWGDCNGERSDGCETRVDTVDHCGACNQACDTTTVSGSTTCDGSKCVYQGCKPGRQNCSMSSADTNGCECSGNACCMGGTCELVRSAGLNGVTYFACDPLGVPSTSATAGTGYSEAMARAACAAWVAANDPTRVCLTMPTPCGGNNFAICTSGSKNCPCWTYQDSDVPPAVNTTGHVYNDPMCKFCPAVSDPTWN